MCTPDGRGGCDCPPGLNCESPGKRPRVRDWPAAASTDVGQLRSWWARWPNTNYAVVLEGVAVADVDFRNGANESLAWMEGEGYDLPDTLRVRTGGGYHLYYADREGDRRNGKLARGVDLRGAGGYVVGPGSLHAGGRLYEVEEDLPLADAPEWLRGGTGAPAKDRAAPDVSGPVTSGGRNETLFRVASALRHYGLSEDAIFSALQQVNLERCRPPLDEDEVRLLSSSAARYEPGRDLAAEGEAADDALQKFLDKILTFEELLAIPPPAWAIDGVLQEAPLTVLYGDGATFKSFIALDWSAHMALGRDWLGRAVRPQRVLYIAAEGHGGLGARVRAWLERYGTSPDGLFIYPGAVNLLDADAVGRVSKAAEEKQVNLVVVDTLARSMVGGEENAAKDVGRLIGALDLVRSETSASALLIHHANKATGGYRGSTAIYGAADNVLKTDRPAGRDLAVTLSCEKTKDGQEFDPIDLALERVGDSLVVAGGAVSANVVCAAVLAMSLGEGVYSKRGLRDALKGRFSQGQVDAALEEAVRLEYLEHTGKRGGGAAYADGPMAPGWRWAVERANAPH